MKKLSLFLCLCLLTCFFTACNQEKINSYIEGNWDNENAVSVTIKSEYIHSVLSDLDGAFSNLNLKGTLIMDKVLAGAYTFDYEPSVTLLLILENGGAENQAAAIETLKADKRVKFASAIKDVPFEPINTLNISATELNVKCGETVSLSVNGSLIVYEPSFSFESTSFIKLRNYDDQRTYTPADFPGANAKEVIVDKFSFGTFLSLTLNEPGYFNVIKAVNAVAQNPNVLSVGLNGLAHAAVTYPDRWQISDLNIAEITNLSPNGWDGQGNHLGGYDGAYNYDLNTRKSAEILCKTAGTFTVTFTPSLNWHMGRDFTLTCTITVV